MIVEHAVLAIDISSDGQLICVGDQAGSVHVSP